LTVKKGPCLEDIFLGKVHFDVKVLRLKERERGKNSFQEIKENCW
jgi:hypothetical protein